MKETKNQIAWKEIDRKTNLIQKIKESGEFKISSSKIKELSNREPRLMAKFDHSENRPEIFKENNISILPIAWYDYLLLEFNSYADIEYSDNKISKDFKILKEYESLDINNVTSEDNAIVIADISKILSAFLEDDIKLTARGKFGTGKFNFKVKTLSGEKTINVRNTGAELDAGFEGERFYILEAKLSKIDDFNIRQLYYPYRYWQNKITKEVVPIFFTYSDGVYSFWEYRFEEEDDFNSLTLLKHSNFIFQEEKHTIDSSIFNIKEFVESDPEGIPFPQADDFEKVINIIELVNSGVNTKEDFADYFSFEPRQADYYFNATRYLELVYLESGLIYLTKLGGDLLKMTRSKRHENLIKQILKHKVFYDTYKTMEAKDTNIVEVVEIMRKNSVLKGNSIETLKRRAQTIISWCQWIKEKIQESGVN